MMICHLAESCLLKYLREAGGGLLPVVFISCLTISCTNSSQIPLTVRDQQERALVADRDTKQTKELAIVPASEADNVEVNGPEADEAELQRIEDLQRKQAEDMAMNFERQTNEALTLYMKAQTAYYNGENNLALEFLRSALEIYESSDLHALAGTVYYRLGQTEEMTIHWNKAVEMDPEVISAMYPGMRNWFESNQ